MKIDIDNILNENHFYHHIIDKICEYLSIDNTSHKDLTETENKILSTIRDYQDKVEKKENTDKNINEIFGDNGKVITTIEIKNKLKALDIIEKKNVSVTLLNFCFTLSEYNFEVSKERRLIKEEYDLLKEVFNGRN